MSEEQKQAALSAIPEPDCPTCRGNGMIGGPSYREPDEGGVPCPDCWVPSTTFQSHVHPWMLACFGAEIAADTEERNHRFLEEALELVQACGATASEAHQLVDYVYGRPVGDKHQEVGGVMVTLAALCLAQGLDMHAAGETELARIWTKVDQIRAKQAAKPKHSPLPEHVAEHPSEDRRDAERYRWLRERNWNESALFVVQGHHSLVRLGTDCPSGERLDAAIDAAIAKGASA